MAYIYTTKDGDVLDLICWNHYGQQSGAVELVLESNAHLAKQEPVLTQGIEILLPDLVFDPEPEQVDLWD